MHALTLISGIFITIAIVYLAIMLLMSIGIWQSRETVLKENSPITKVSVIVPARNEETNILNCLHDLEIQDYPFNLFEVVLVNDCSTDRTVQIAEKFKKDHPVFFLTVISKKTETAFPSYKKEAIKCAIANASGELILTTDADVRLGKSWVSSIVACYEKHRPKMILGPVTFHSENTFFMRVQSVEFLALMTATAGLCNAGMPVMCNGANLAYEKNAFYDVGGFKDNLGFPSGDDMFLMIKLRKRYGAGSIRFLWNENSIVRTNAVKSFRDFWHQRLRWVSKNKGYRDVPILFVAISTWLFNFILLAGLIGGIFSKPVFCLTLFLLVLKMLVEFPALYRMAGLLQKRKLLWLFPVVQLLNIVYVSVIGLVGNFLPYKWKGRRN